MDWWFGLISPPGNTILVQIVKELCEWIPKIFDIEVFHFPYHVEHGGIYLKDAAVMAGLGCIGRNNLLVTPEFGPRIRLRAMALSVPMPSTGPIAFDPAGCAKIYAERPALKRHLTKGDIPLKYTARQFYRQGMVFMRAQSAISKCRTILILQGRKLQKALKNQ